MKNQKLSLLVVLLMLCIVLLGQSGKFIWGQEPEWDYMKYHAEISTVFAASLGPDAPSFDTCGLGSGLEFSLLPLDTGYAKLGIFPCYDGSEDITLRIPITGDEGDPLEDGQTIVFEYNYVAVAPGETMNPAVEDVATATGTYTQVGAGVDCEPQFLNITLDRNHADQPYEIGDGFEGYINVTAAATYDSDPLVGSIIWIIPHKKICDL